jgi:mitochondrial fission protein ELM1
MRICGHVVAARRQRVHNTRGVQGLGPGFGEFGVIWVLDDPRAGIATQAIGIAERLGVPFRRIPLRWNWKAHVAGLAPAGSLIGIEPLISARVAGGDHAGLDVPAADAPSLVISAGRRSAPVALWLRAHYGCKLVHCMSPGIGGLFRKDLFDLLVIPAHDRPAPAPNVIPVFGAAHRVSPMSLAQAELAWRERLAHLPHPRIVLLVGGPVRGIGMQPAAAHDLGRAVAQLAVSLRGSVLATTSRRTGDEASEALATGLGPAMHVLYRWGEPDENPYMGFLATADAVVVTADSVSMISEACATEAAVYVALPEQGGNRHRAFIESLVQAGQVRPFVHSLAPWARTPLDEAGRIAEEVRRRFDIR